MRPSVAALVATLAVAATSSLAADLRPSWECLPDDTAVMVRLPCPATFITALRTQTKFGAVALAPSRLEAAWQMLFAALRTNGGTIASEDVDEALGKYGLRSDDLAVACSGDMGMAFVLRERPDRQPLVMMLVWLEPGDDTATRLVTAAQRRLEEAVTEDDSGATRRIDLELAGHEVLWMIEPVMGIDPAALDFGGVDIDPDDEAGMEKRLAELQERIRTAKPMQRGRTDAFMARIGGRLVVGQTIPMGDNKAPQPADDRDFAESSGADEAKGVFEEFLVRHTGDARSSLASAMASPDMEAVLPGGVPLVDIVCDPRIMVDHWVTDEHRGILQLAGMDTVGPVAWRQSLDQGTYRNGLFVSLPSPRRGLMRIVDLECDPAVVPPFVPHDIVDFTQISLDLGRVYDTIKEFVVARGGEEAGNMVMAVELQTQGWLGIELPRVLTALGSRHWILNYPQRIADAVAEARRVADEGAPAASPIADRTALVWKVGDEAPFDKLLQRLAGMTHGEIKDEQGFRSVRLPDGPAVSLGRDHLVVATGGDTMEKVLASIRNPPTGASSFRESDVPRKAAELVSLEPARVFGLSDSTRSGGTIGMIRDLVAAMVPEDVEEPYRELLGRAQSLLPSSADMEGMFGVGVTTVRAGDAGVAFRSAWEMPPP